MNFIGELALLLLATTLAGHFSRRAGMPAVVAEILVGIIAGPAVLGWVANGADMKLFANLGVILLMFLGGLESDIALLKKYLRPAIIVACAGVVLPVVLGAVLSRFFGFNWFEATFIGVIFSATSVSISVEVLKEYGALSTREGATILGAAVADDIIGVILLSIMIALMGSRGGNAATASAPLWLIMIGQVAFFGVCFALIRWVAPFLLAVSGRILMTASPIIAALVICFAMAWLADFVSLSGAVGAFFAGLAVAQTPYKAQAQDSIEPIGYAVFIPLFFVSVGLDVNFNGLADSLPFIIVMTVMGVVSKLIGCGVGARLSGFDGRSSYIIGAGMISRGEMALITAQIGFSAHLLAPEYFSDIILVIIVVTMIAPFMLRAALRGDKRAGVQGTK
ncbi:cation:proton antiporter [Lacticaseibacillus pabuli]|uniref:Cation:proton antiporter n=1 Tax=Lacticaseibacillus pabuli TaxID=3025672 RepID=A0ABY7WRR6_9LACO|nr:cation:proton antiporter [Lacticaseibacillus sp. KACC 23028]WDF82877.1 cation:proton antiporter [Lacticaseibacillus sp. KACC 23028]